MGRLRNAFATAAVGAVLAAQTATAQSPQPQPNPPAGASPVTPTSKATPATQTPPGTQPAPVTQPAPQAEPEPAVPVGPVAEEPVVSGPVAPQPIGPASPVRNGGGISPNRGGSAPPVQDTPDPEPDSIAPAPSTPDIDLGGSTFLYPGTPAIVCEGTTVPPELLPIYQAASVQYGLGSQGPAVLAAINKIETNFGELNQVTSYAGAIGWMQFMPATWDAYGVDADSNGVADPYDPDDAIFSAANYLSASGMPEDTPGAIFSYNHADWYVAEVLADAGCFGSFGSDPFSLAPSLPVFSCAPAPGWGRTVPERYLAAFEDAAGRYELGRRGVWALAAVSRLESNFGKTMGKRAMRRIGPLGLDATEWKRYAVDANGDGHIRHRSPADSAATLARMIWSRGSLRAGIFTHNQASWYVDVVLRDADRMRGECTVTSTSWPLALPEATASPINWANLTLTNPTQITDLRSGAIDPRIVGLIGSITQRHTLTVSSLRSDHSMLTTSGNVSNHYFGRAFDLAAVDGVSCTDVSPSAPCAVLGRTLTLLPPDARPTELIYCFDLDGAGPAFAAADHCDHIHAGFND